MRRDLRELQPEIRDVRIGHRLLHPGAYIVEIFDQIIHGEIAAQQHLIADDHPRHRVRIGVGLGDGRRDLLGVIRRVGAEPDAEPKFEPRLSRQPGDIRAGSDAGESLGQSALHGGIGAYAIRLGADQPQVLGDLRRAGKPLVQRALPGAVGRVGERVELARRHGHICRLGLVGRLPQKEGEQAQQRADEKTFDHAPGLAKGR
jgi:hypothetical protein